MNTVFGFKVPSFRPLGFNVLRVIVALPAIGFVVTGLRYIIDPTSAAEQFGMPLLDGVGRSSQIGNMAAFFLSLGLCILIALSTGRRIWFYPAAMLTGLTALFRVLAWLLHDAGLAVNLIAPELIVTGLLLFAASRLPEQA